MDRSKRVQGLEKVGHEIRLGPAPEILAMGLYRLRAPRQMIVHIHAALRPRERWLHLCGIEAVAQGPVRYQAGKSPAICSLAMRLCTH